MDMIKRGIALLVQKPNFRNLMGAQFLAQAGDGIVQFALAKFIVFGGQRGFDLEGARSPDELLRIALVLFIPYTIVSPFLGVVIDRWDRRRLLFLANGLRAVVVILIALAGVEQVPEGVLLLAFLLTLTSTRIVLATKGASLPASLDEDSALLVPGNAVSQLGGALFQLGGAAVALVAAEVLTVEPIVIAGGLVYGAGAAFALAVHHAGEARSRLPLSQEVARVVRNIVAGFAEVARTPKAGSAITTYFWLRFLWSFSIVGIGFVARELLGADDTLVIVLTGAGGGLGGALGFVTAGRLTQRVRSTATLVLGASTVAGGAVALLGALQMNAALAVLTFFLGFGFFVAKISLDTMVQESLGDDFRGRAFALYDIAYNLAWVLAAGIMKIAYSPDTLSLLIAAIGAVFLIGIAGIGLWFRQAGLLAPTQTHRAAAPQ
jgi:hypothetical protein